MKNQIINKNRNTKKSKRKQPKLSLNNSVKNINKQKYKRKNNKHYKNQLKRKLKKLNKKRSSLLKLSLLNSNFLEHVINLTYLYL